MPPPNRRKELAFDKKTLYNGAVTAKEQYMHQTIEELSGFLNDSYTAYQATERAAGFLQENGFRQLSETETWELSPDGKYYVVRGGSALIAFRAGNASKGFKIVSSHTDSPCLKLKEQPARSDDVFTRLNAELYGGGLWYSFFDRPLKLAGQIVSDEHGTLIRRPFVSAFTVLIPSLAIHQNREANEKFAPDPQSDLQPLLSLKKSEFDALIGRPVSYDLFAACAEAPFVWGANDEFLSSPRLDNLTSVYASLRSLAAGGTGACLAACFDSEEIGSRTRQGAGSDFLRSVLERLAASQGIAGEGLLRAYAASVCLSLDNAHSVHPNHPEKCDPTNRTAAGGGIVIKGHAGGAYTTDAFTSAIVKTIFRRAGVPFQTFYNRSDMRSGSTLGAISLGQAGIPSVDIGLAQLAMHSAVETIACEDYLALEQGLSAFYGAEIAVGDGKAVIG